MSPSLNSLRDESHRQPGSLGLRKRQTEPKIPEQELLLPDQRICSGADAQTVCFNKNEPNYFGLNEKFLIYKGFLKPRFDDKFHNISVFNKNLES